MTSFENDVLCVMRLVSSTGLPSPPGPSSSRSHPLVYRPLLRRKRRGFKCCWWSAAPSAIDKWDSIPMRFLLEVKHG